VVALPRAARAALPRGTWQHAARHFPNPNPIAPIQSENEYFNKHLAIKLFLLFSGSPQQRSFCQRCPQPRNPSLPGPLSNKRLNQVLKKTPHPFHSRSN
jgi:hypothetical protein